MRKREETEMRKWMRMGKQYKTAIACALAGLMLLQTFDPAALALAKESLSENSVESEAVFAEDALQEEMSENGVSGNSLSENSVSENTLQEEDAEESVTENTAEEESVSENTAEESLSENTTEEESVSENTTEEESVSENTTEEGSVSGNATEEDSVSGNATEESLSENTTEEGSVSENTTEEGLPGNIVRDGMSAAADVGVSQPPAPTIKSIVPKDTTAEICFTHLLAKEQAAQIQYEVQIRDEIKGVDLPLQSGKENGVVTIGGYDGSSLNRFQISGLAANKKYSVILWAKYGEEGNAAASAKKTFTTKKDMLATDGSMKIRYADMEQLKNDRTKTPVELPAAGVEMKVGENCALYAQVSRLMRAVETDKLKWLVQPLEGMPKNGLKVKASKSTYEAVLTAEQAGSYQVTATNTLSKETVSVFWVTVK